MKIYTGGASLIDYSIILTAAHPLEQIKSVVLVFQTWIEEIKKFEHILLAFQTWIKEIKTLLNTFFRDSDLIVRCGEWNTQNEDESQPFQVC